MGVVDERRHEPTADRWWGEAWTFELAATDGSLGGYVRLQLLPNQNACWYWAWVVGPGRQPVVVLDQEVPPPRGAGLELRANGLWADHIVEEPYDHVSVGAEAFALRLDDPDEAYAPLVGVPTPFGLDLGWETVEGLSTPVRHLDASGEREGYSLPCRVVGEILVADERIEVDAVGHRHHSWGIEDWWSAGWIAAHGRLDDGTWFATHRATAANTALDDRIRVAEPDRDLDLDLAIEPLAYAPVPVADGAGRRRRVVRALSRYGDPVSGRRGVGWTEWNKTL